MVLSAIMITGYFARNGLIWVGNSGLGFALMGHFQTGICCAFLRTG